MITKEQVKKVIEDKVRKGLQGHGGDIELIDVKDNKVYVKLQGACGCCPGATATLRYFVEEVLKEEFKEDIEVVNS